MVGHGVANGGWRGALFQAGHDVLDLEAVELGERVKIDQRRRFQITEPDTGCLEQSKLAAGINATDRRAGGHLERLFDSFESLALRDNAPVQVNGELAGGLAGEKVVERDHALDFDGGDIQRDGCTPKYPRA